MNTEIYTPIVYKFIYLFVPSKYFSSLPPAYAVEVMFSSCLCVCVCVCVCVSVCLSACLFGM